MSGRGDRGTAAVELAIVAPVLIALMLLVVFAGRVADAEATVQRAAAEAARAASLRQHPSDAIEAAQSTAESNLSSGGVTCVSLDTSVDTGAFRPGGTVSVTVTCVGDMSDLTFIGVPGTRQFRADATEIVDVHRSDAGGFGDSEGAVASNRSVGVVR